MAKVLVIRLSSFGDAALLVPVIYSVASHYPQDRFTVLTRTAYAPLFSNLAFNVNVAYFDAKKRHKGLRGLLKLVGELAAHGYSHVVDEHDVLRSKILRRVLWMTGSKVATIKKGRADKARMIETKVVDPPLQRTTERYADTFDRIGFPAKNTFSNILFFNKASLTPKEWGVDKKNTWVGIAPFAKHKGKIYPTDKMEQVISLLSQDKSKTIILFGAGAAENEILKAWEDKYPGVHNVSNKFKLEKELILISHLDVMVSMDSANMHLASLVNVPVVSIWGATHPSLGFYGYKQDIDNAIQTDIECRPCSVFGDLPCARGDYACLTRITEQSIVDKINALVDKKTE